MKNSHSKSAKAFACFAIFFMLFLMANVKGAKAQTTNNTDSKQTVQQTVTPNIATGVQGSQLKTADDATLLAQPLKVQNDNAGSTVNQTITNTVDQPAKKQEDSPQPKQ